MIIAITSLSSFHAHTQSESGDDKRKGQPWSDDSATTSTDPSRAAPRGHSREFWCHWHPLAHPSLTLHETPAYVCGVSWLLTDILRSSQTDRRSDSKLTSMVLYPASRVPDSYDSLDLSRIESAVRLEHSSPPPLVHIVFFYDLFILIG